jgi:trans-2,3-dihydro-3-hydroxyanthranilate isomerase
MMSPSSRRYRVVDVFTTRALEGNPLAVFPEASGIDDATLQKIARELNLAETAFVIPSSRPDCAAGVRIFTPSREMPFAGHPTIGTSFVLLEEGVVPRTAGRFLLEERIGPVAIHFDSGERPLLWLRTPPITFGPTVDPAVCARMLGLDRADLLAADPQVVDAGNSTLLIALTDRNAVDRAWIDRRDLEALERQDQPAVCVFVFAPTEEGAYSRMFAPLHGVPEDPATGSSTGPLAAFMIRHGLVPRGSTGRFISEQGVRMGRRSLLHVRIHGERGEDGIDVGGFVTPIASGIMELPTA